MFYRNVIKLASLFTARRCPARNLRGADAKRGMGGGREGRSLGTRGSVGARNVRAKEASVKNTSDEYSRDSDSRHSPLFRRRVFAEETNRLARESSCSPK